MDKTFEIKGYWWNPSAPEDKMVGTLYYKPGEPIRLDLIGTWRDDPSFSWIEEVNRHFHIPVLQGISSKGMKISVANCIMIRSRGNSFAPFHIYEFEVHYLLVGIYLSELDERAFKKARVSITDLSKWCPPKAISISIDKKTKASNLTLKAGEDLSNLSEVRLNEKLTLSLLEETSYYTGSLLLYNSVSQCTVLQLESSEKESFLCFVDWIEQFKNFLSFALLKRVGCIEIVLYKSDEESCFENTDHRVQFYVAEALLDSDTFKPYFLYRDIQEIFPSIITQWYDETLDYELIKEHLLASIESKVFDSVAFLIVTQAIEGIGIRKYGNNIGIRDIIERLYNEYCNIIPDFLTNDEIASIVDSRHHYSHTLIQGKKPKVQFGTELYCLTHKLRVLLVLAVSSFIGLDERRILNLLKGSNNGVFVKR